MTASGARGVAFREAPQPKETQKMPDTFDLSIDMRVAQQALAVGLNMSRLAEAAIADATLFERRRLRREQCRAGLEAFTREVTWPGTAPAN